MIYQNLTIAKGEDRTITFNLVPAQPVGGWGVVWTLADQFDASARWTAYLYSGTTNGASGITVLNSGQGWFQVSIYTSGISGLDYGNYATRLVRTDSGNAKTLAEGLLSITP